MRSRCPQLPKANHFLGYLALLAGPEARLSRPATAQQFAGAPEKARRRVYCTGLRAMAGPGNDPVQVYRTGRANHWEFLRLWTGFELSSSWSNLPCYGVNLNRNILDFMRWPQIDLAEQDLNGFQRPKSFRKIAGSKVLDEYYNTYLRK
jgi:hypothetical protein